jgi:hypothetical protein
MSWLADIPEWIVTVIVIPIFGAVGFLLKGFLAKRSEKRIVADTNISNLESLIKSLHASQEIFIVQRTLNFRLLNLLETRFPGQIKNNDGFEKNFTNFYDKFNKEEKEWHSRIRSLTENSLHSLNNDAKELASKLKPELFNIDEEKRKELQDWLKKLDHHLNLWLALYESWIPENPNHSLVYLNDEQKIALGFPLGIETFLEEILAQTR